MQLLAGERDGDARQHGVAGVGDGAGNRPGLNLRSHRGRGQKNDGGRESECPTQKAHAVPS